MPVTFSRNAFAIAACVLALLLTPLLISGSQTKAIFALTILAAPIAILLAVTRPMLFPYGLYAFLIPFDNLLTLSTFGTGTRLLGLLAGVALMFWTVRRRLIIAPPASLLLWVALLAWMALTLTWTSDFANGIKVFGTMVQVVLLYAIISITPIELRDVRSLIWIIIGGGFVAAIFGYYVFHHQTPTQLELQRELGRLQIQIGESSIDVNHFANALLLPIAAMLVAILNTRSFLAKLVFFAALATMIGAVYVSASREALIAVGIMMVYLAVVSRKRLQLVVALAMAGVLSLLNPAVWQRFAEASATGGAGRTSIWAVGLAALRHHWLIGSGLGSFTNSYDEAYIGVFQHYPVGWSRDPHNLLLHNSVELGILGVALTVVVWAIQFRMLRCVEKGSALYDLRIIATAALIGLSVCAMFIDLFTYKYLWLLFAFIAQVRVLAYLHPQLAKPAVRSAPVEEELITDNLWGPAVPSHAH
ncbi:MAG: O-antigen ligase family protein [Candidatus Eremiobacteraeota bacterium]|nr:O-antigen ligase family protein [Candidatus Eremiobacteraeota bacterium]